MAGPLDALERFMEEAVEGTVQRVFRPKLQPVQLAKAAARAMERQQVIGTGGPEVPNSYTISLHPRDFEQFAQFQGALQRELETYLTRYAADHGWRPVSTLGVVLVADSSVPLGRPRIAAELLDLAESSPHRGDEPDLLERTMRQPRFRPEQHEANPQPLSAAVLISETGEQFALRGQAVRIGRALENDIVIADPRVSRFHAEIRQEQDRYVIYDLGSTNGTLVADTAIDRRELTSDDLISLGGFRLSFLDEA
jgi:hypothetical protein